MGSIKPKLTRSFSTPSPLNCDLSLTGVSLGVNNKLENSKSLPTNDHPGSSSSGDVDNTRGNFINRSKYFLIIFQNSFGGFVLFDRQGVLWLSVNQWWRQWSEVSETIFLLTSISSSLLLSLCHPLALWMPSVTLQNPPYQESTFSPRGLLRHHRWGDRYSIW